MGCGAGGGGAGAALWGKMLAVACGGRSWRGNISDSTVLWDSYLLGHSFVDAST